MVLDSRMFGFFSFLFCSGFHFCPELMSNLIGVTAFYGLFEFGLLILCYIELAGCLRDRNAGKMGASLAFYSVQRWINKLQSKKNKKQIWRQFFEEKSKRKDWSLESGRQFMIFLSNSILNWICFSHQLIQFSQQEKTRKIRKNATPNVKRKFKTSISETKKFRPWH